MTSSIYAIEDVIHANETISSLTLDDAGNNYENPVVTIDPPPSSGTTATATAVSTGPITDLTLIDGGKNYTSNPSVTITGTGTGATASTIMGRVNDIGVSDPGSGYTSVPKVTIGASPTMDNATAKANVVNNKVQSIDVIEKGSGYTSRPSVTIKPPNVGSDNARAEAFGSFGEVDSISLILAGTGYETNSINVDIIGGGGAGAEASGSSSGPITTLTLIDGGSGYDFMSTPNVVFSDSTGSGSGALATAIIEEIDATENILDNDIVITNDMVKPGGGGILRLYFSFEFAGNANSEISVTNNNVFKGILNADNSKEVVDGGFYRFDLDVEANDSLNFQSSVDIDNVNFIRTHLVQFGA